MAVTVELWPDNVDTINVFRALDTQWRVGVNGPTGLDYAVLPAVLRLTAIPRKDWPDVFAGLRVCEGVALEQMHKK